MFSRRILIRIFVCCSLALIPFPEQENQIYDVKSRILSAGKRQPPAEVVILEISKADFDALKRTHDREAPSRQERTQGTLFEKFESVRDQFFWNDAIYLALLQRLLAENPRAVLITFFYPDNLIQLQSRPSLQRLTRNPKMIWASQFDADQKFLKPASELVGEENYGFNNLYPDPDGTVRRAALIWNNHGSLPFRALLENDKPALPDLALQKPFLVHYQGKAGTITTCSILEKCSSLNGKYVILTAAGGSRAVSDSFPTPVGTMSRAEILGNILLTAKKDQAIIPVPLPVMAVFVFIHLVFLSLAIINYFFSRHLLLAIGLHFIEAILVIAALGFFRLQIPYMPFVLATLSAYIIFLWLKYARQENRRWQAEKKAQYLGELDELKSNFISLMSHDLKTPIAKVQALTERLAREAKDLTVEHREILEAISKSNDELTNYIVSILNFQKIESQKLIVNPKSNDINLMIEDVVKRLEALAKDKKILLLMELEPMFSAEFDEILIKQVLNNLIENAIKYNNENTKVVVKSGEVDDYLFVSVEDDGIGIEESQQNRLFKKFSRVEKGTAERVKGTGLGLYLSKYFIELHGGRIEVNSVPGKGTIFTFFLPINNK